MEAHLNSIGDGECRPAFIAALTDYLKRFETNLPDVERRRLSVTEESTDAIRPAGGDALRGIEPTPPDPHTLETDDMAWDAFVARGPGTTHLQTTGWASVKRANGWHARRVALRVDGVTIGSQILSRRAGRLPWRVGYIPRGPIGAVPTAANLGQLTARLREQARADGLAYLVFEPEVEIGSGLEAQLERLGWRRTSHVQPEASRVLDLTQTIEQLEAGLRSKWRQYVHNARRSGMRVVQGGEDRLDDFYRIYADAYRRAGVTSRSRESFSILWQELAPRGMAHLFLAESENAGEVQAALLLVSSGARVAEVYGGSTPTGNTSRANYLLKWEAIVRCREMGFAEYDMYGIPHAGIAHFKAGFGGREVRYVGAWELVVDRLRGAILASANSLRLRYVTPLRARRPRPGVPPTRTAEIGTSRARARARAPSVPTNPRRILQLARAVCSRR